MFRRRPGTVQTRRNCRRALRWDITNTVSDIDEQAGFEQKTLQSHMKVYSPASGRPRGPSLMNIVHTRPVSWRMNSKRDPTTQRREESDFDRLLGR